MTKRACFTYCQKYLLACLFPSLPLFFFLITFDPSYSSDSEMWCFAMQRIQQMRTDFTPTHALPVLESEFAITKDGFLKFMIRRLGPLHAMQLLLKETEFAKGGISHEAYKVYVAPSFCPLFRPHLLFFFIYQLYHIYTIFLWLKIFIHLTLCFSFKFLIVLCFYIV